MRVQLWDTAEIKLTSGSKYANPFTEVDVKAVFVHEESGSSITANGFYDGDSTWCIRFMPQKTGEWKYTTTGNVQEMDGKSGSITCEEASLPYLHGPLKVSGSHFFHIDGTPRFLVSTRLSCHLSQIEQWEQAIEYLKAHGINRIFFMMGGRIRTTGCLYGEGPDFWRYNIESFRAIDTFINALKQADIIASPYFYYFNDAMQCSMTAEQDKAYIRYGMARFGAYANVMPVLSNEVELKYTTRKDTGYQLRSHQWCNEMGQYLKEQAVFGLPVTVHNPQESNHAVSPGFYTLLQDWPFPWADCMLRQAQVGALGAVPEISDDVAETPYGRFNARAYARHNELLMKLRRFGVPVINEEPGYEMAGYRENGEYCPKSWNTQNPDTLIPTFWTALTAGAYTMWGSFDTYELGNPLPGIKWTITPKYLKILHDFIANLPYWEMEPCNEAVSPAEEVIEDAAYRTNFCLAKKGEVYVVYSLYGETLEISLTPGDEYQVEQMDTRNGKRVDLGRISGVKQIDTFREKNIIDFKGRDQVLLFRKV